MSIKQESLSAYIRRHQHQNGVPEELQQAIDGCTTEKALTELLLVSKPLTEAMLDAFDKRFAQLKEKAE